MGKPLQQDENGNIINDTVTQENQKGYANYESNLKKKQDKFKDETSIGEKIGKAVSNVAGPVFTQIGRMMGSDQVNANRLRHEQQQSQKQYEAQDKQEGRGTKKGGMVGSASKRADGCCVKGKTRGKMI